jgi:hypothetical protein
MVTFRVHRGEDAVQRERLEARRLEVMASRVGENACRRYWPRLVGMACADAWHAGRSGDTDRVRNGLAASQASCLR